MLISKEASFNFITCISNYNKEPSWSYGTWIYNYLCNPCLSPTNVASADPAHTWCTRYNIM